MEEKWKLLYFRDYVRVIFRDNGKENGKYHVYYRGRIGVKGICGLIRVFRVRLRDRGIRVVGLEPRDQG